MASPRSCLTSGRPAMAVASLVLLSLVACISRGVDSPASPEPPVLAPARIAEILASPDRNQTDRTNDLRRKPYDMLNFIAIRPGMVALDLSAGGGYTSELLARSVGPAGRVYAQTAPRVARPGPAEPVAWSNRDAWPAIRSTKRA